MQIDSSFATASRCLSSSSAYLSMIVERCWLGVERHVLNAIWAAATAESTSALEATCTLSVMRLLSKGLYRASVSRDDDGMYY